MQETEEKLKSTTPGKIVLLAGTSTAGKTTLCNAVKEKAKNAGHDVIIDGTDAASDRVWTQSSEIDGITYKSANDHFIDSMKQYVDPNIVTRAVEAFDPRTLIVAVFSRKNLGNPKVDTVNLEPEDDLDIQAKTVFQSLSQENQEKYKIADIKDLLLIIKTCPPTPEFLAEHPYPPLARINDNMLDRAIEQAKNGTTTILDIIGNETITAGLLVEHFKEKVQSSGLPIESGMVVIAHCPINVLTDRISHRNNAAKESGNLEDIRQSFFPFQQYATIYKKASDQVEPDQIVGKVSRDEIKEASKQFGNGEANEQQLLNELNFSEDDQSISIVPKFKCDLTFQTATMSPNEITDKLYNHINKEVMSLEEILDSVPKTQSGAIDLTKAERIAEGGTHVLYRFPEASFVIKVMKNNPNLKELEELERKYAILYDCFDKDGKQRCIHEQHITHHVNLEGETKNAALSIVPYERCFQSKVKFDFQIEPAELDPYLTANNSALCEKANNTLINQASITSDFDLNDYVLVDERIGNILKRLDEDPKLRVCMIEFLNHYRDFYQSTHIILDALGHENILFFKDKSGDWQFKIGSAIKHDTGEYTNTLFAQLHNEEEVNLDEFVNFTHAYFSPANIRAVNVCAMKLGLEPVISDVRIEPSVLHKISQSLSVGECMLAYARHGDFEKMNEILQENRNELTINLRDFWTYPLIADEYTKHGQSPLALKNFLDTVSAFPVVLPENKNDAIRVQDVKMNLLDRKNVHNKKIELHQELSMAPITKLYKERMKELTPDEPGHTAQKDVEFNPKPFNTIPKPPWET